MYQEIGEAGEKKNYLWSLQVFGSGTVKLTQADLGGGSTHLSETLTCEGQKFEVTDWNYGGEEQTQRSWEKHVTEIKFKLDPCEDKGKKEVCDIKIAKKI